MLRTMRPPTHPPQLPECVDVRLDDDGMWRGTHEPTGRPVSGDTWEALVADACAVRIIHSLRKAWS